MTPEAKAREKIDAKLVKSGWSIQDLCQINPTASLGVAVREYPTSTGPADYVLFIEGNPVGIIEAKKDDAGENITTVERQSERYASSALKYMNIDYRIRFAYEATGILTRLIHAAAAVDFFWRHRIILLTRITIRLTGSRKSF